MKIARCLAVSLALTALRAPAQDLATFARPPAEAKPWVYWFWLNGNLSREGITADLEAMARVGVGGVLIMEVDQGAPDGPAPFASPPWRELFSFMAAEAARLGIQVNMNNDAGWCGSGGPWMTPELAMQRLTWSETPASGRVDTTLAAPPVVGGYYRDIAVLAYPKPSDDAYRIPGVEGKSCLTTAHVPMPETYPEAPEGAAIAAAEVLDVTARMAADGRFVWDAPAGDWLILRLGHTLTGAVNAPSPTAGRGLESDKLSRVATKAHFDGLMTKLCDDLGPLAGRTLVSMHIDSWETGSQNWTPLMREQFRRLRGYDPLPWLPVVTGRVLGSLGESERFLRDLRQTVSDLILTEYTEAMRDLAHERGLRLSIEAYGEPADDLAYGGRADEPMSEFWTYGAYGAASTCEVMSSSAHVYGRNILGAEAFTASDAERWQAHPGTIKVMGDWAFCLGINRFVFHRYAMQPWVNRPPGMSMGPWGLHYERTNTWWEDTGAYHNYLSRCQWMLRRGRFVADVLYCAPENAPAHWVPQVARPDALDRPGYNFDACPAEVLHERVRVENGRLVLPDGMSYSLLVLPPGGVMSPALLRRAGELVKAGATVLGEPPSRAPGLTDYPACDAEVKRLAGDLWRDGGILSGQRPEQVLAGRGVPPDFEQGGGDASLRYIHRRDGETDLYFVANKLDQPVESNVAFRIAGRAPELWHPESGERSLPAFWQPDGAVTRLRLRLGPAESVFVVFSRPAEPALAVTRLAHAGQTYDLAPPPAEPIEVRSATYGPLGDAARTVDVTERLRGMVAGGVRSFKVAELANPVDPAYGVVKTLTVEYSVGGVAQTGSATDPEIFRFGSKPLEVTVVRASYGPAGDAARTIDVTDRVREYVANGLRNFAVTTLASPVDPAVNVLKTLTVEYQVEGRTITDTNTDGQSFRFRLPGSASPVLRLTRGAEGLRLEVEEGGQYTLTLGSGRVVTITAPEPAGDVELGGPWRVGFEPGRGAPEAVTLPQLASLSRHADDGVKYFAGSATYATTFRVPAAMLSVGTKVVLDLGRVEVLAEVTLNGKSLGTLWRAPYVIDATPALRIGENALEVRVVTQWINRMIGDEQLPDDSRRHGNGTLVEWPDWLAGDGPSPTGRYTFTSWRLWGKDSPLVDAGLIGPVRLRGTRTVLAAN